MLSYRPLRTKAWARARPHIVTFLRRHNYELRKIADYQSETSKCRERLARFCVGYGVDLGTAGDPITETAVRIDLPTPYAKTGPYPVQLGGDASKLHWFNDGVLDYVYSSHLLEDFPDTKSILKEWLRVLKLGGRLILFCPDQKAYEAYCASRNDGTNPHHAHADFSLKIVQHILDDLGGIKELYSCPFINHYSWELVVEKR
jgi:SAM-dependent methyltransferase